MTTAFAIGVLFLAAIGGLSFVWWMFSGASALIEPDEPAPPERLPAISYDEDSPDE